MDKRIGTRAAVAVSVVACMMATSAAAAPLARLATAAPMAMGVDVGFLWQPEPDNDTQIYLHVSNIAWEPSRSQVEKVYPKLRNPEWDFPMLAFMARESRSSLQVVWKMRAGGMSWVAIMGELKIPQERLIPEMRRKGGPPKGVAHGYWKKRAEPIRTDDDIYYWVNIQMMSRYFGVSPVAAAGMREEGASFKGMATRSFNNGMGKAQQYKKKDAERAGMEPAKPPARRGRPTGAGSGKKSN